MRSGRLQVAAVVAIAAFSAGCGAPGPPPALPPASPSEAPSFGPQVVTLAELGFRNGPVDRIALPAGVRVSQRVDQPNVVTVLVTEPAAEQFVEFADEWLPAGGFEVLAASETGIVFAGFGWDGGISGGEISALTLRKRA